MKYRNTVLENRIKRYILNNKEVSKSLLIKQLKSSYYHINRSLEDAGICLLSRKWHTENKILKLDRLGMSYKDIGKKLKINNLYVGELLRGLGIRRYHKTYEDYKKKVLMSYKRGNRTIKKLVDDLNISKERVMQLKEKLGLPPETRGRKKEEHPYRDLLLIQGHLQTEVARIEEVDRRVIYEYLKRRPEIRKAWERARERRNH